MSPEALAQHESEQRARTEALKTARAAKGAELAGDCVCPQCGEPAFGMAQPYTIKHVEYEGVEIGCLLCRGVRAFGPTLETARANFKSLKARNAKSE